MAIVLIRTLIVYLALMLTIRLLGKRQLGEMELPEFVVASLIADLAAHPLQDIGIPMINGLIPVVTLFCCEVLIAGISLKHIRLRSLLFGKPSILIAKGVIDQGEMESNRFTLDELMQELRGQGVMNIDSVECAILEANGKLNILLRPADQPVTPAQLNLPITDGGIPQVLICDGRVIDENLSRSGHDRKWLDRQLRKRNLQKSEEVFLMTVDRTEKVYLAEKRKKDEA